VKKVWGSSSEKEDGEQEKITFSMVRERFYMITEHENRYITLEMYNTVRTTIDMLGNVWIQSISLLLYW